MTKNCPITGKGIQTGNNVPIARSHSGVRTRRTFVPNLQNVSLYSDILGTTISLRVSVNGLRTIEKNGGLDQYLLTKTPSRLTDEMKQLKKQIEKAKASKGL